MFSSSSLWALLASSTLISAHTVITYPGWRGDNLMTNGTLPELNPDTVGIDFYSNGSRGYPYGMQWMYPCGGMAQTTNRTKWPVNGGAVSIQPGWFPGHSLALMYINIGIQEPGQLAPPNYSHIAVPRFGIAGPSNSYYDGQICIPQVGMPANLSLAIGTNITIQVVEVAQHGAALYSCVDVTLADPSEVEEVTPQNCYNSSDITFTDIYTVAQTATGSTSAGLPSNPPTLVAILFMAFASIAWSVLV